MGGRLRSQPFEGADGVVAELGGMRFPISSTAFYHYVDQLGLQTRPFPNPLTRRAGSTVDRPRGRHLLRRARSATCRRCSARSPTAWARGAGGGALHRHPGRDPRARRGDAQGAVERPGAALGRPHLLRLRRHLPRLLQLLVPAPRGVRPGRLRHRRLGHGLPELDAGDPARRDHQLRRGPAPGRRRRRAGAARLWRCARADVRHWPAGTSLDSLHSGAPRPGVARIARGDDGRFAVTDTLGRHAALRRGAGDLPDLAAHHADRMRGEPVLARSCGWPWTAPATCSPPRPS